LGTKRRLKIFEKRVALSPACKSSTHAGSTCPAVGKRGEEKGEVEREKY